MQEPDDMPEDKPLDVADDPIDDGPEPEWENINEQEGQINE